MHNYHAKTDSNGYFSIPLECLSFNTGEQIGMDEFGNPTGSWEIPNTIKLWIVHEGDSTFVTDWYEINPDIGNNIEDIETDLFCKANLLHKG